MGNYGIEKSKQLLMLGFGMGGTVKKSLADGKIDITDVQYLVPLLPQFLPLVEDFDQIPKEFSDIDELEVKELLAFSASHLGGLVESEKLAAQVKASFELGLAVLNLIKSFK